MAIPTIVDTELTFQIFGWLKKKMRKRFVEFSKYGVRSLQSYNTTMEKIGGRKLPSIVLIIDDIGTFFKRAPKKTRQDITEITLLARAAGIYLIVVSQSASSLILNSDIKSNLCGRFAFKVNNMTESRTIMESEGAEKLLGVGECYYDHTGRHRLGYAQVPYVSHEDISKVVSYVADRNRGKFTSEVDVGEVMREVTGSLF